MHVAPVALVDETPRLNTDWSMVGLPPKELVWRMEREREVEEERERERKRERRKSGGKERIKAGVGLEIRLHKLTSEISQLCLSLGRVQRWHLLLCHLLLCHIFSALHLTICCHSNSRHMIP